MLFLLPSFSSEGMLLIVNFVKINIPRGFIFRFIRVREKSSIIWCRVTTWTTLSRDDVNQTTNRLHLLTTLRPISFKAHKSKLTVKYHYRHPPSKARAWNNNKIIIPSIKRYKCHTRHCARRSFSRRRPRSLDARQPSMLCWQSQSQILMKTIKSLRPPRNELPISRSSPNEAIT